MKWNDRTKKAATYGVVGVVAWLTGTVIPPEVVGQIVGAFG